MAMLQQGENCSNIWGGGGGRGSGRRGAGSISQDVFCYGVAHSPNLLPEPPQPLPYLEDLTAAISSAGPSTHSVLTSPSGTKLTVSPGSSALIGKSSTSRFLDFKVFRVYITVTHLVNLYIKDLVIQTWALRQKTSNQWFVVSHNHCQILFRPQKFLFKKKVL